MRILNKYIIKEHIAPFFFALSVIMFILLMNFLVKYIGQIFGKGLSAWIIFKLVFLNLSWMLALAVPMATLVAVLMAYGRFSADNEITILKSSGISIYNIIRPSLYLGLFLTLLMIYFSDQILPESNHLARQTFKAVREKKPTLQLEEHIFYEIDRYTFLVDHLERPLEAEWLGMNSLLGPEYQDMQAIDRLRNITIFDRSEPSKNVTIIARHGYMVYSPARKTLIFTLFDGEFHELDNTKMDEYQRTRFNKTVVHIPAENFDFEEQEENYRGDREMNIKMMRGKISNFKKQINSNLEKTAKVLDQNFNYLQTLLAKMDTLPEIKPADSLITASLTTGKWRDARRRALRTAERYRQQMRSKQTMIENQEKSINKYAVEIYKKISIPFASIVFVLVGAPLGVMARKGSMGVAISMSIGFFLLYWAFLIGGEDFADRKLLAPFLAMWAPNIIVGIGGLYLTWRAVKESSFIRWDKLAKLFKRKNDIVMNKPESAS